jgi:hypothetical protein
MAHAVVDPEYYLVMYPDVSQNWRGTPQEHYDRFGAAEGRSPVFDEAFYLAMVI